MSIKINNSNSPDNKLFFNSDNRVSPELLDQIKSLDNVQGIYLFKDENEEIIYVGKSKKIRNRVASYFRKKDWVINPKMHWRTKDLVRRVKTIEIIITMSELEALLLEDKYIKKYLPKYNVRQKNIDDNYLKLLELDLSNDFPVVEIVDINLKLQSSADYGSDDKLYFGPFPNTFYLSNLLFILQKYLFLRNCKKSNFRDNCFDDELGICSGPCKKKNQISKEKYREIITDNVIDFLSGKNSKVIIDNINAKIRDVNITVKEIEKLEYWTDFMQEYVAKMIFSNKLQERNLIITEKLEEDKKVYCSISKKGFYYNFSDNYNEISNFNEGECEDENISIIYDRIGIIYNYLKRNKENSTHKFIK